jgi:hypothetical protein
VLSDERLRRIIDLDRPVGVLLVAVLHLLTGADKPTEAGSGWVPCGACRRRPGGRPGGRRLC